MNAQEIYARCSAFQLQVNASKTVEEAEAALASLRQEHDSQCLRCYHSEDDPKHQPRQLLWWSRKAECPYVPRVPVELRTRHASTPQKEAT